MMKKKKCIKCGKTKLLNKFPKHTSHKDRHENQCKECKNLYQKLYDQKHKKDKKEYRKTKEVRFRETKRLALNRELEFLLTFEEHCKFMDMPCFYCNDEMNAKSKTGSGLDRINNKKGYTNKNVFPCCSICNSIRNNFLTVEETQVAIKAILKFRKKNKK